MAPRVNRMGTGLTAVRGAMNLKRLVLAVMVLTGGGGYAAYQLGLVQLPSAGLADMGDWDAVNSSSAEVVTTVWVDNPNPLGINISNITVDYTITLNRVPFIRGTRRGVAVQQGNQTLSLRSTLVADNIPRWWASHLSNGEQSMVRARVRIEAGFLPVLPAYEGIVFSMTLPTDLIGMLDGAMQQVQGTYKGPGTTIAGVDTRPRIEVRGGSAAWGRTTPQQTELRLTLSLHNPNEYAVPTPESTGEIVMNDITVADWNANDIRVVNAPRDGKIDPGATRNITFVVIMDNGKIDDWLLSHIRNGEWTDGHVTIRFAVTVGEVTVTMPRDGGMRCAFHAQTGLLVDGQENDAGFEGCRGGSLSPPTSGNETGNSENDGTTDGLTGDSDDDGGTGNDSNLLDGMTGKSAGSSVVE